MKIKLLIISIILFLSQTRRFKKKSIFYGIDDDRITEITENEIKKLKLIVNDSLDSRKDKFIKLIDTKNHTIDPPQYLLIINELENATIDLSIVNIKSIEIRANKKVHSFNPPNIDLDKVIIKSGNIQLISFMNTKSISLLEIKDLSDQTRLNLNQRIIIKKLSISNCNFHYLFFDLISSLNHLKITNSVIGNLRFNKDLAMIELDNVQIVSTDVLDLSELVMQHPIINLMNLSNIKTIYFSTNLKIKMEIGVGNDSMKYDFKTGKRSLNALSDIEEDMEINKHKFEEKPLSFDDKIESIPVVKDNARDDFTDIKEFVGENQVKKIKIGLLVNKKVLKFDFSLVSKDQKISIKTLSEKIK